MADETMARERAGGERWRLALLGLVAATVLGIVALGRDNPAFGGRQEPREHARLKQKEELDRRFREGVALLRAKQYDAALGAFQRVLELDPQMPEARVNAGYALLGLNNPRMAADFFDSATVLRPDQLNAYFGLGEALLALGDKQGALQAMETYVHRSPSSDPFHRKAEAATWELRAALDEERRPFAAVETPNLSGGEGRP